MSKLLQKIKIKLFGPPGNESKTGWSMSSSGSETDFQSARSQPIRFSAEIDETETAPNGEQRSPRPAGDGWKWDGRGSWVRPIKSVKKCGHYFDSECSCDDPEESDREANEYRRRSRSHSLTVNNPFAKYNGRDR